MEGAGRRTDHRARHGGPRQVEAHASLTATSSRPPRCPIRCRQMAEGRSEAGLAVPPDRQGRRARRRAVEGQRHREIRHRRAGAGHGLRRRCCIPTVQREKLEQRRRRRRQEDQGRRQRSCRCRSASASSPTPSKRAMRGARRCSRSPGPRRRRRRPTPRTASWRDYRTHRADWIRARRRNAFKNGDADAALDGAAKVMTAEYLVRARLPCPHGADERRRQGPTTARSEIWVGTQAPGRHADPRLDRAPAPRRTRSTFTPQLLGGGFGRRIGRRRRCCRRRCSPRSSQARPVKMIWTREDDMQNDKFRPLTAQRIEDRARRQGRYRRLASPHRRRDLSRPCPAAAGVRRRSACTTSVSGGGGDMSYDVANHRVDWVRAARGVDVGAWRGIAAGYNKFAIETLLDELAAAKGMDPVAYRLALAQGPSARRGGRQGGRRDVRSGARSGRAGRWASPIPTRCTATLRRRSPRCRSTRRAGADQGPPRLGRGRSRRRRPAEEHRGADRRAP